MFGQEGVVLISIPVVRPTLLLREKEFIKCRHAHKCYRKQ